MQTDVASITWKLLVENSMKEVSLTLLLSLGGSLWKAAWKEIVEGVVVEDLIKKCFDLASIPGKFFAAGSMERQLQRTIKVSRTHWTDRHACKAK